VSSNRINHFTSHGNSPGWFFYLLQKKGKVFMQAQFSKISRIAQVLLSLINIYKSRTAQIKILRAHLMGACTGSLYDEHKQFKRPGRRYQESNFKIPRLRGRPYVPMRPLSTTV
jgi:hypothetical protein